MDENQAHDDPATGAPHGAIPTPRSAGKPGGRRWGLIAIATVLLVPALLLAAWTAIALNWSYSEGNRAGYIQKFSHKGWVCKTWEGELQTSNIPGSAPQLFLFSVRDDSVANQLTQLMGSRVTLTYKEHRGVLGSCFGETNYYVTGARVVP